MGSAALQGTKEANRDTHLPQRSCVISQGDSHFKDADTFSSTSEIPSSHAATADESESKESFDQHMTEDELEEVTTEIYSSLKKNASEAMAVKQKLNDDGVYIESIRDTIVKFEKSYFMLEKASLEQMVKFRLVLTDILLETEFINIICDCLIKMYIRGWIADDGTLDRTGYHILICSIGIAMNYSDASDGVVSSLASYEDYMETIKTMLEERASRHLQKDGATLSKMDLHIINNCLGVAHNVSMRSNSVYRLRSLGFTDVMKPYLNSWDEMISLAALATLAGIVNEAECDIINASPNRVKHLLEVLENGLDTKLRRYNGWSCKECAFTVRLLAQNDANKKLLVQLGALKLLVKMGRTGNKEEQCESVEAIWALCFDKNNQQQIAKDESLGVVELLFELKKSENARIRKACNGALWTLRDALASSECQKYRIYCTVLKLDEENYGKAKREENKGPEAEEDDDDRGHIMISYQWDNQQLLKDIRDKLKENKFKVWMDIDEMGGSTVQAMATAVENAEILLLCISQKYKNSPNCRAEAEYAFKKNKEIIPLKMERGYDPDGWLGLICGAKTFYDFSGKYKFEDKCNGLLRELAKNWNRKDLQFELGIKPEIAQKIYSQPELAVDHVDCASPPSTVNSVTVSMGTVDSVRKWTDSELKSWIDKNGLKSVLPSNINTNDIALLLQMRKESPDFFYKCTHDMLKIRNLSSLSKLVWALQTISRY